MNRPGAKSAKGFCSNLVHLKQLGSLEATTACDLYGLDSIYIHFIFRQDLQDFWDFYCFSFKSMWPSFNSNAEAA
jgi:hypothetical protein